MASTPRHHVVPQFLLRRWADAETGLLSMVSRDDLAGRRIPTSVKNACNEAGFYRIETEDLEPDHRDGHDPEAVEGLLSVFESRGEAALRHMAKSGPPWNQHDRFHVVNFAALQYVRGWRYRREMNEMGTNAMRRELRSDPQRLDRGARKILRDRREAVTPEAVAGVIDEIVGADGPRLVSSQPHAIQTGLWFAMEQLAYMLWVRGVRLVSFDESSPLLISDAPVVTWSPGSRDRVVPPVEAAAITMPVGPFLALSFVRDGEDSVAKSGRERARQINLAVADSADKWVFMKPGTDPLVGLDVPAERPRLVDEFVSSRVDEDGNYRELWQTVYR